MLYDPIAKAIADKLYGPASRKEYPVSFTLNTDLLRPLAEHADALMDHVNDLDSQWADRSEPWQESGGGQDIRVWIDTLIDNVGEIVDLISNLEVAPS